MELVRGSGHGPIRLVKAHQGQGRPEGAIGSWLASPTPFGVEGADLGWYKLGGGAAKGWLVYGVRRMIRVGLPKGKGCGLIGVVRAHQRQGWLGGRAREKRGWLAAPPSIKMGEAN